MTHVNRRRLSFATALAATLTVLASMGLATTQATAADSSPSGSPSTTTTTSTTSEGPAQVVLKVRNTDGCSLRSLDSRYPVVVDSPVLKSRGIYLVHGKDPAYQGSEQAAEKLAHQLAGQECVAYAEPNLDLSVTGTRFHSWRFHSWRFHSWDDNGSDGSGEESFGDQPAVTQLNLDSAHRAGQGAGTTVAVLDTGIDASHPVFEGRITPGYDYVSDDSDPSEGVADVDSNADGDADSAVGHGTFTAGLVSLVAPQAKIMPMRVLDSDGNGNLFIIAQAILEAADAGVEVVNLSFGTSSEVRSQLITHAITNASKRGVVVVAAAGNNGTSDATYPGSLPEVISVAALDEPAEKLASFSSHGDWVAVASPGSELVGPVPGNRLAQMSGTSMAAPIVAGQVALLAAFDGLTDGAERTATQRRGFVTGSADALRGVRAGSVNLVGSLKLANQTRNNSSMSR